jgi:hypothetical protein
VGEWEPDEKAEMDYRTAYLWIVPAKAAGTWTFKDANGATFTANLTQTFQKLSGDVAVGSAKQPLVGASLRGEEIRFAFNDDKGVTRSLTGTVRGNEINGTLRGGGADTKVSGTRK